MLSHLLNFLSLMAIFSSIGRISRGAEDVNLKSKQEINARSPPFTTVLSLKNPYNKVGIIKQIILSPGNVFIITSYFLNQILASNYNSSMFLNITKTVIEVSYTLIIPKSQCTIVAHSFIPQMLLNMYYVPGTIPGSGDLIWAKNTCPFPHQYYRINQ